MEIPYIVNARKDTGLNNSKIAIWLFLASEVMLFGGLFSSYIFLRIFADYPWPERALPVLPGLVNTFILIASSVTVVFAWAALKLRKWPVFVANMSFTLICAAVFMVFKAKEYSAKFHHQSIQYNDWSIVEGHTLGGNHFAVNANEVSFKLASYYNPYYDEIFSRKADSELRIENDYIITEVNDAEDQYTEKYLAKKDEIVDQEKLTQLLIDAKEYFIKARTHNQEVRTAALNLAWKYVRKNKSYKGHKFTHLVGKSHYEPEYKEAVNNLHADLIKDEVCGSLMKADDSLTVGLYNPQTIKAAPAEYSEKQKKEFYKNLSSRAIVSSKPITLDDKVVVKPNESAKLTADQWVALLGKEGELEINIQGQLVKVNPSWGHMNGKTVGQASSIDLKDSTSIKGIAADSGMEIAVDAIDFRHMVMKLEERIKDGVEDPDVIHKAIDASPILKNEKIAKLWAMHQEWLALFTKHLQDKYGKKDDGTYKRIPTHVDKYRLTWKQIVAYTRLMEKGEAVTLENAKSLQPTMLQGFTGADHYNEEFKKAFATITVPRDQIRFESVFSPKMNNYYAIYFTITGLHGLHVVGGALVLGYFLFFGYGMYKKNPDWLANRVEVAGLFWHFVDLVWIFVFPIFYLM